MAKTQTKKAAEKPAKRKVSEAEKAAEKAAAAAKQAAEDKAKTAEAMEAENKKKQAAAKAEADKAAAKVITAAQEARDAEKRRPLSVEERARLEELEELAKCKGRSPFPTEMLELGRLRERAKLDKQKIE